MVYLDNIIIYLNSKKEYKEYVKWVLGRLYKKNILVIIKKCKFYTKKIDLRQIYHQIQIKEGNKQKEAFRTKEGLFKPTVMQFKFTNTPVIF